MRHRFALLGVDLALIGLATICAQLLRDNFETSAEQLFALLPYVAMSLVAAILAVTAFGLNRSIWRLSGMADHVRIATAAGLTVILAVVLGFLVNRSTASRDAPCRPSFSLHSAWSEPAPPAFATRPAA
jgi:FlaA1/EpsC-like NDP-sugar epimerase